MESDCRAKDSEPLAIISCSFGSFRCTSPFARIAMKPHERLHWHFHVTLKRMFGLVFIDIFEERFTYSVGYLSVVLLMALAFAGIHHTTLHCDTATALNSVLFLATQLTVKYLCVRDLRSLAKVANFISQTYAWHSLSPSPAKTILFHRYSTFNKLIINVITGSYGIVSVAFLLYPAVVYVSNGITVTPLPIYFAAIDEQHSRLGYAILVVYHWLLTLFTFCFNSAFDSFMTIIY